jgi:hypothetical protein
MESITARVESPATGPGRSGSSAATSTAGVMLPLVLAISGIGTRIVRNPAVIVGTHGDCGSRECDRDERRSSLVLLLHHLVAFQRIDAAAGKLCGEVDQTRVSMNVRQSAAFVTTFGFR